MNNKQEIINDFNKMKKIKLIICLLIDIIGTITFFIPGANLVWAPISGLLIFATFGGSKGVLAGFAGFTEEIFPGTDFLPTATAMWVYIFVIKKNNTLEDHIKSKLTEERLVKNYKDQQKRID